ncbi:MAG: twin-arginine translocation signal domain-containing protein, partial [Pseudomonadota bacterium]|nr:twin-arginine translocation signal domain-containing protein [Pseudomonadota bacterium]
MDDGKKISRRSFLKGAAGLPGLR